jgi:hypothetical protein
MYDEVATSFKQSDCARMMVSINWLIGFVQGAGYEIPQTMVDRLLPLAKAAGIDSFYPDSDA